MNEEKILIYLNVRVNLLLIVKDFDIGVMVKILKELNFIRLYLCGWVRKLWEGDISIVVCM